jgi:hypothetical protein
MDQSLRQIAAVFGEHAEDPTPSTPAFVVLLAEPPP